MRALPLPLLVLALTLAGCVQLPDRDADCCFDVDDGAVFYSHCVWLCQGDETEVVLSSDTTAAGPPGAGGGSDRSSYGCDDDLGGIVWPGDAADEARGDRCAEVLERLDMEVVGDDDDSAR